ncbi:MAG: radical SAM protein [Candidatus Stahlbacteria bacterium]|nr:radical SAM protein [Candidatus Stahlbacteria bacterium]
MLSNHKTNAIIRKLSNSLLQKTIPGRILTGPTGVQLAVSNACNSKCIMCWINSPLIHNSNIERLSVTNKKLMDFKLAQKCISHLALMGTKNIYFVGLGEPLLNNKLPQIIAFARSKGINCYLTTNGILLNKSKADELINSGLNAISISLHAATPETYKKIHPTFNEKGITHIKEMLNYIHITRQDKFPEIQLNFVISALNVHEIIGMIKYTKECSASYISFIPVWTCRDLNSLLLSNQQIKELYTLKKEVDRLSEDYSILTNYDSFLSTLTAFFNSNAIHDKRTQHFYSTHPCTIGYMFCLILADGNVLPCCASCLVMGNIEEQGFREIWYSKKYVKFRKEGIDLPKKKIPIKNCEL